MAVAAITPDYAGERRDRVENFHGNQIVYVGWDHHLMFCSPVAFAVPPETPFSKLQDEIIPGAFSLHPDFGEIDWDEFQRVISGNGPCNRQRMAHHIKAHKDGAWVREAMSAYDAKRRARKAGAA